MLVAQHKSIFLCWVSVPFENNFIARVTFGFYVFVYVCGFSPFFGGCVGAVFIFNACLYLFNLLENCSRNS